MVARPEWIEYHLSHEGEWLLGGTDRAPAPPPARTVMVARVWFDRARRCEFSASSPSAAAYRDRLLLKHPFDAGAVRRWALYQDTTPFACVMARNKYEAARQSNNAAPEVREQLEIGKLRVVAEDELDPAAWTALLHQR
jgi:hypothetical protein